MSDRYAFGLLRSKSSNLKFLQNLSYLSRTHIQHDREGWQSGWTTLLAGQLREEAAEGRVGRVLRGRRCADLTEAIHTVEVAGGGNMWLDREEESEKRNSGNQVFRKYKCL